MLSTRPISLTNKTRPNIVGMLETVRLVLTELLDKKTNIATNSFFEHLNNIAEKVNETPPTVSPSILPEYETAQLAPHVALHFIPSSNKLYYDIPQLVSELISPIIEPHYFDLANKLCLLYVNLIYLQKNSHALFQNSPLQRYLTYLEQLINGSASKPHHLTLEKLLIEQSIKLPRLIHISSILINRLVKHTSETKEATETTHKQSLTIQQFRKAISHQLKSCKENLEKINSFLTFANSLLWQTDQRIDNPADINELFIKSYTEPFIKIQKELLAHRLFLLQLQNQKKTRQMPSLETSEEWIAHSTSQSKNKKKTAEILHPIAIKNLQKKLQAYQKKLSLYYGVANLATVLYKEEKAKRETDEKIAAREKNLHPAEIKNPISPMSNHDVRFLEFASVKQAVDHLYYYLLPFFKVIQAEDEQQHETTFKTLKMQIDAIFNATSTQPIEEKMTEIIALLCHLSKDDLIEASHNQLTPAEIDNFSNGIYALIHLKKLLVLSRIHQDTLRYIPYHSDNRLFFLSAWAKTEIEALQERVRTHTTRPPFIPSLPPIGEDTLLTERKITEENSNENDATPFYQQHKTKAAAFLIGVGIGMLACFIPGMGLLLGPILACTFGILAAIKHKTICGYLEKIKSLFLCDKDTLRHPSEDITNTQLTTLERTSTAYITRHSFLPPRVIKEAKTPAGEDQYYAAPFSRPASSNVNTGAFPNSSSPPAKKLYVPS